jgi:hypothetical protein
MTRSHFKRCYSRHYFGLYTRGYAIIACAIKHQSLSLLQDSTFHDYVYSHDLVDVANLHMHSFSLAYCTQSKLKIRLLDQILFAVCAFLLVKAHQKILLTN